MTSLPALALMMTMGAASTMTMQYWAAVPFTWPAFFGWVTAFGCGAFFAVFARGELRR